MMVHEVGYRSVGRSDKGDTAEAGTNIDMMNEDNDDVMILRGSDNTVLLDLATSTFDANNEE